MNRNPQNNESSLLLQLPKSVLSFSDMSGSSFLMPVAVDDVVEPENSLQNSTNAEKCERTTSVTETVPVCQLQQPLLKPRGSSGSKMAVPYSESNAQTANVDSVQAGVSHFTSSPQPSVSDVGILNHSIETHNWPSSSTAGPPLQSSVFSGFQNQPPTLQPESVSQLNSFLPNSLNQENISLGYQNVFPQVSTVPKSSNFSSDNVPGMSSAFPGFSEQSNEYHNVNSSAANYYSQPPVMTPSTTPVYNSERNSSQIPQAVYPNISNPNYNTHNSNVIASELYSRVYEPVKPYWLFRDIVENKEIWYGFSNIDSSNLEMTFARDPQAVVPVDGGRYDALLGERIKKPVYFEAKDLQIRRCTWFYRPDSSQRFIPFPEEDSNLLEQHYANSVATGQWQKRINLPGARSIVLENPQLLFYCKNEVDVWPSLPDSKANPKPVRRGLPENFEVMPNENNRIDHLVFIVQGIGSFCDLRFRTVVECVDGFRDIANKLLFSHFTQELENGRVGRVEFLPLAWHAKLHTSDKGFDRCMQNITLPSIPKLRHFTNDTLLDILLYSSPTYCQSIVDTVASELNKLYEIFLNRNPGFSGSVFVAGHSLGSLILFDILAHQKLEEENNIPSSELHSDVKELNVVVGSDSNEVVSEAANSIVSLLQTCHLEEYIDIFEKEKIDLSSVFFLSNEDLKDLGLPTGPRKKLLNAIRSNKQSSLEGAGDVAELPPPRAPVNDQREIETQGASNDSGCLGFPFKTSPCMSSIIYPKLHFEPACFFALGSPISMFLTVRGYDYISDDFRFPTCPRFFHIFHPYDPVAFRIEPLIDPTFSAKPVLIPHHKGRKRMHIEIRENLSKVGAEIKQKVIETLRYTWESLSGFAKAHTFSAAVEAEVDKIVKQQMIEREYETHAPSDTSGEDLQIGSLNGGRRIDYVLQEKPIEALNDYIFALTSHATYWDSEDTVLMILQEIYATQGIIVTSIETKYPPSDQSFNESYAHLNAVMSDRTLFDSPYVAQALAQSPHVDATLNGSVRGQRPVNRYASSLPQVADNVPPPAVAQPVGPPPLTGFVKRSPFNR